MARTMQEEALGRIVSEILDAGRGKGWSNAELARRAGISPESLSRLKTTGRADFATIWRLAETVDLDILVRPKESWTTRLERGLF